MIAQQKKTIEWNSNISVLINQLLQNLRWAFMKKRNLQRQVLHKTNWQQQGLCLHVPPLVWSLKLFACRTILSLPGVVFSSLHALASKGASNSSFSRSDSGLAALSANFACCYILQKRIILIDDSIVVRRIIRTANTVYQALLLMQVVRKKRKRRNNATFPFPCKKYWLV